MKIKILIAALFICGVAQAQIPPGYTSVASRYQWIAGQFKDGLNIPAWNGAPSSKTGVWVGDGQIGVDTLNHVFYIYSGGWKPLVNSSVFLDSIAALRADIGTGGGGSGVTDGNKGDITVASSGAAWTVNNGLAATKIGDGSVSTTEFQYINSLTSNAQTQITAKASQSALIDTAAAIRSSIVGGINGVAPVASIINISDSYGILNRPYDSVLAIDIYGATLNNRGLSASGLWNGGKEANKSSVLALNNLATVIVLAGLNDIRRGGSGIKTMNKVGNGVRTILANSFAKFTINGANSAVTRLGFANSYVAADVGGKYGSGSFPLVPNTTNAVYSTTAGDTAFYSALGTNIGVQLIGTSAPGDAGETYSNAEITVRNSSNAIVMRDTVDLNNQYDFISDGVNDNRRGPVFWWTGKMELDTYKITVKNLDNNYCIVDGFWILNQPENTKAVVIGTIPYLPPSGYAFTPSSGSIPATDSANNVILSEVADFQKDGYPATFAPTNAFTNITTDMDGDSIHRNPTGNVNIANGFKTAIVSAYRPAYSSVSTTTTTGGGATPDLQAVTDVGATTTNAITASTVKIGTTGLGTNPIGIGVLGGTNPVHMYYRASSGTNNKNWWQYVDATSYTIGLVDDAQSASTDVFKIIRNGYTAANIVSNFGQQIQGALNSPTGAGFELEYNAGTAYVTSYNRTGSAWLPMIIRGSTIDLQNSGTSALLLSGGKITKYNNTSAADGKLLIGKTSGTTYEIGSITSPNSSINIGYSTPNITVDIASPDATYTPTLTNTTNVAASTAYLTYYTKVGDWVHVWGVVDIDATTALTISELQISLPVSSSIIGVNQLAGTGAFEDNTSVTITGNSGAGTAKLRFTPQTATNNKYSFHFSYKYIAP